MKTKLIIAALLLAASSAFAQVPSYVPTNGLVGWWPFNGNANDESGNGNNGTVSGATFTSDRNGVVNSAFSFDGVNDYIRCLTSGPVGSSARTISYWMKSIPSSNTYMLVSYGSNSNGGSEFDITYNSGCNLSIGIDINLWVRSVIANAVNYQDWNFVTVTYDPTDGSELSNVKYYINGLLLSNTCSTGGNLSYSINTLNVNPITFGRWCNLGGTQSNGYHFNGNLDDIGIWNRALSQQEITALYNAQSCTGTGAITADGPTTFCAGNYVNLTSDVVGGTYQWKKNGVNISTNGTSRTYKATATGSYTCVAICNGTALTSNAIQVTSLANSFVSLTASGATSFCAGDSVTLNATNLGSGYSVQWYRTNISMQGATNYSVVVKQPGTYKTVTKNLSNGCSRISSGSVVVAVNCRLANPDVIAVDPVNDEIPATKLGNGTETTMHLFPNPNAGSFTLEYDGIEADFEVQVLNTMGQVIYNDMIPSNDKHLKTSINLGDNLQKGIYVVRIINGENVHESKVMLQ